MRFGNFLYKSVRKHPLPTLGICGLIALMITQVPPETWVYMFAHLIFGALLSLVISHGWLVLGAIALFIIWRKSAHYFRSQR